VLLVVVLGAIGLARSRRGIGLPALVVALTFLLAAALWRLFPDVGRFPFSVAELAAALAFCAAGLAFSWRVEAARPLRYLFGAYAVACLASYLIPSGIGENVVRLRFVAIPIAVLTLSLRGWRPLVPAVTALALALSWNVTPLAASFARSAQDPSASAAYWRPVVRYLHRTLTPSYRVEAVDTAGHWDAVYLARAGIPLVRGWFRQDDFPQNALLYHGLDRASYLRWLRGVGVRYVVLTSAPVDYSSRGEARLLRSGRSGLVPVLRTRAAVVYAVPDPVRIVTGPAPAVVERLSRASVSVRVGRPGTYRLAVRYSPYFTAHGACIARAHDGMTTLEARRAGDIRIRFSVTPRRALAALAGTTTNCRGS
jgi:hypothetical protein